MWQKKKKTDTFANVLKRTHGIGPTISLWICRKLAINPDTPWEKLGRQKKESWEHFLTFLRRRKSSAFSGSLLHAHLKEKKWPLIDENLYVQQKNSLLDKLKIKSKRALRIRQGYPARGQKTRTNAKTALRLNRARV